MLQDGYRVVPVSHLKDSIVGNPDGAEIKLAVSGTDSTVIVTESVDTVAALLSAGTLGIAAAISSDVGMLTASSTQVPLYRHWITNLPYNLAAAAIALVGFAIVGIMGIGMPA